MTFNYIIEFHYVYKKEKYEKLYIQFTEQNLCFFMYRNIK